MTPDPFQKKFIMDNICKGDEKLYQEKFEWMDPNDASMAISRFVYQSRGYSSAVHMYCDVYGKSRGI